MEYREGMILRKWNEHAIELYGVGVSRAEVVDKIRELYFPGEAIQRVQWRVDKAMWRRAKKEGPLPVDPKAEVETALEQIHTAQSTIIRPKWTGEEIIRFGIVSDTHLNNMWTQISLLHRAYETFDAEGITTVYHCGDIDDGEEMRLGHKYECYNQGGDAHVEEIVRVYPKLKNGKTLFLTGNHDHSLIKRAGMDIGHHIAAQRPDMAYLGPDSAVIYLTDKCTMELRHPIDGTAYAISYKVQKMVEAMSGGEKPNIFAVGHYHKQGSWFYRNVQCLMVPTLCAQTPWMRGKGIAAEMGYYIIEVHVHDDGTISRFTPTFFPAYRAIKDDWKNWR